MGSRLSPTRTMMIIKYLREHLLSLIRGRLTLSITRVMIQRLFINSLMLVEQWRLTTTKMFTQMKALDSLAQLIGLKLESLKKSSMMRQAVLWQSVILLLAAVIVTNLFIILILKQVRLFIKMPTIIMLKLAIRIWMVRRPNMLLLIRRFQRVMRLNLVRTFQRLGRQLQRVLRMLLSM